MKRVTMVTALVLTGLLLQGQACTKKDPLVVLGLAEDEEAIAKQKAEEEKKLEEARRAHEVEQEQAKKEQWKAYYEEVIAPPGTEHKPGEYGPGDFENFYDDVTDIHDKWDESWAGGHVEDFNKWQDKRAATAKAEETYYDAQVLGTGKFPSLTAYREAKKKDPALRTAEENKQATWERKRAAKNNPTPAGGEGGGGGGGGGGGEG